MAVIGAERGDAVTPDHGGRPGDAALLGAWERACDLDRPWREIAVLEAVDGVRAADLARLPIGERDRRLMVLHRSFAGRRIECETDCPACGERLELELDADRVTPRSLAEAGRTVEHDGRTIRVRPPDTNDVAACMDADDAEAALLERCAGLDPAALGPDLRRAVAGALASIDPGADLSLSMECPACGAAWEAPVDPASLVFDGLTRHAEDLLRQVDQLARAYGWPERDVLALSPARRRAYLRLTAR